MAMSGSALIVCCLLGLVVSSHAAEQYSRPSSKVAALTVGFEPVGACAGSPFSASVKLLSRQGAVVSGEKGVGVTVTLEGGAGDTLLGTTTVGTENGVATFTDLAVSSEASGLKLRFVAGTLKVDGQSFSVLPADSCSLVEPSIAPVPGGTTVTVMGHFGDGADVTGVSLAGVPASIKLQTDKLLVVSTGAAASSKRGQIVVTSESAGRRVLPFDFEYGTPPVRASAWTYVGNGMYKRKTSPAAASSSSTSSTRSTKMLLRSHKPQAARKPASGKIMDSASQRRAAGEAARASSRAAFVKASALSAAANRREALAIAALRKKASDKAAEDKRVAVARAMAERKSSHATATPLRKAAVDKAAVARESQERVLETRQAAAKAAAGRRANAEARAAERKAAAAAQAEKKAAELRTAAVSAAAHRAASKREADLKAAQEKRALEQAALRRVSEQRAADRKAGARSPDAHPPAAAPTSRSAPPQPAASRDDAPVVKPVADAPATVARAPPPAPASDVTPPRLLEERAAAPAAPAAPAAATISKPSTSDPATIEAKEAADAAAAEVMRAADAKTTHNPRPAAPAAAPAAAAAGAGAGAAGAGAGAGAPTAAASQPAPAAKPKAAVADAKPADPVPVPQAEPASDIAAGEAAAAQAVVNACDDLVTGTVVANYCAGSVGLLATGRLLPTPEQAGWERVQTGLPEGLSEEPISADVSNLSGWRINDLTANRGAALYYRAQLDDATRLVARSSGWELAARVRVLVDGRTAGSQSMGYTSGTADGGVRQYGVIFALNHQHDLSVNLLGERGGVYTVTANGLGDKEYHTHSISVSPTGAASYSIDGRVIASGWMGRAISSKAVQEGAIVWGSASSAGKGSAVFQMVQFGVQGSSAVARGAARTLKSAVVDEPLLLVQTGAWHASEATAGSKWKLSTKGAGTRALCEPITFPKAFAGGPPKVTLLLRGISGSAQGGHRVGLEASQVSPTGMRVCARTWGDSLVRAVALSWVAVSHHGAGVHLDSVTAPSTDHTLKRPGPASLDAHLDFDGGIRKVPVVLMGLKEWDVTRADHPSFRAKPSDVTPTGMKVKFSKTGSSAVLSLQSSLVALDPSRIRVQHGEFKPKQSKLISGASQTYTFSSPFASVPQVSLGISSLGWALDSALDVFVEATNVTRTGFTLRVKPGSESVLHNCEVGFIAVDLH